MPELPEVETTRLGIRDFVIQSPIKKVIVRESRLRWSVPNNLNRLLSKVTFNEITRRGKYLLFHTKSGCLIVHLGMSGHLRIVPAATPIQKHDHIDWVFNNGNALRYTDPRRFGAVLWTQDPLQHILLKHLGVEPLNDEFNTEYLFNICKKRSAPIKQLIMNSRVMVGVGNIYASEALFASGICPTTLACKLSKPRINKLVIAIKRILEKAIIAGGTTLKDYYGAQGQKGYFSLSLAVYGRKGEACQKCATPIKMITLGQRSTFYCSKCQKY